MVKTLFAAVAALSLMVAPGAGSTSDPVDRSSTPASISSAVTTTRVAVPLASPQSLTDALRVVKARGFAVEAYRFENTEIVGEYSPETGLRPDAYLADFEAMYGTQPQVVAVLVDVPVTTAEKWYVEDNAETAPVHGPAFVAKPVGAEHIDALLSKYRESRAVVEEREPSLTASATRAAAPTNWRPTGAADDIFRVGSSIVYFSQYYYWDGVAASTDVMNTGFGFEMEINIQADSATYGSGLRPYCAGGYKDQPFAKNYGWTWAALVNTGGGMGSVSSAVGAYADYNDLSDPCNKNSMAIGFRAPWQLPNYPNNSQEVMVTIQAPRGVENTGYIGGVVQSVSSAQCTIAPWLSNTDCMGVTFSTVGFRTVLNEDRHWRAPEKCWFSGNYGSDDPVTYPC